MDNTKPFDVELVDATAWRTTASAGDASSDVLLRKEFVSEVEAGEDDRTIKFVISTGDPDREKDIISPDGWNTANYLKNPVVLFAHDYGSLPVARATNVKLENGNLVAEAEFADEKLNPMAEQVYQMLREGYLRGASVGFRPLDFSYNEQRGGVDFSKQELLEFSVVPVPANPGALMSASADANAATLKQWAKKTLEVLEPDTKAPVSDQLDDFLDAIRKSMNNIKVAVRETIKNVDEFQNTFQYTAVRSTKNAEQTWRDVVLDVARSENTETANNNTAEVKANLAKHYADSEKVAPWERDGAAWSAYVKARQKLIAKTGTEPTQDQLAYLLDDHGFEDEAIALVSTSKQSTPTEAVAAPSLQEEPASDLLAAVARLSDKLDALASQTIAAPPEQDDDVVFELDDTKSIDCGCEEEVEVDSADLQRAVRSALSESVSEVVASELTTAMNKMRGRID